MISPLQLLRKAYSTKKIVMVHGQQIIFDKKNIISIYVESGWTSNKSSRRYQIGSIWLYLECERGNLYDYKARLQEYKLQQVQDCDKQEIKDQFLNQNQNQNQTLSYKLQQNNIQNKQINNYYSNTSNLHSKQQLQFQINSTNKSIIQQSQQISPKLNLKRQNYTSYEQVQQGMHLQFQQQSNNRQKSNISSNQQQKRMNHERIHQKYITNPLMQSKNRGWYENMMNYTSSYLIQQTKKPSFQEIIYEQVRKEDNRQDFYGPYFGNNLAVSKTKDQYLIQAIKFCYQIQKPLTNEIKCLQISKTNFNQYLNIRKSNNENISNKKNRYTTIVQKCKNPIIIVPYDNSFNGTLYLANFEKFATHAQYVENIVPPSNSAQKKYQFSYVLKGQHIIFELIGLKQIQQLKDNIDSKQGKQLRLQKDQKSKQEKDFKQSKAFKLHKQVRQLKQNDKSAIDWSLVVGIVIHGKKEEYEFYNKVKNQHSGIEEIKLMLISWDKKCQRTMADENTKYLTLDKTLRYKDSQVQRQFWKQIQNYLFN